MTHLVLHWDVLIGLTVVAEVVTADEGVGNESSGALMRGGQNPIYVNPTAGSEQINTVVNQGHLVGIASFWLHLHVADNADGVFAIGGGSGQQQCRQQRNGACKEKQASHVVIQLGQDSW